MAAQTISEKEVHTTSGRLGIEWKQGALSMVVPRIGGWRKVRFAVGDEVCEPETEHISRSVDGVTIDARYGSRLEKIEIHFRSESDAVVVSRTICNESTEPLPLEEIRDGRLDEDGCVEWAGMHEYTIRCLHTANQRTEVYPDSRPEFPYLKLIPYEPRTFGVGEGNHFPAVALAEEACHVALIEGDLNQTRFERHWTFGEHGPGLKCSTKVRTWHAKAISPLAAEPMLLQPGASLEVSRVFYQVRTDALPDILFDDYVAELGRHHTFCGRTSPLLHSAVYCTWNYGTLHQIEESLLLRRARVLAGRVPQCRYFLIDDGYQAGRGNRTGFLDCFYPEPSAGFNPARFPNGMKAMADELRALGLVPSIWLSPSVWRDSRLALEHPDWLLTDADGRTDLLGNVTFLDLSVPDARAFFLNVLDTIFHEWGYRGLKLDFFTQWFSLSRAVFRGGSGLEWRDWVYRNIRERIGDDGIFMTCIAMSMGNPFPGLYADAYRCGCDIHNGTWQEQRKACKATLPQTLIEGRRTFLLNMDSAGFGDIPQNEQIFRLTWVFITQGIIELGGPVENLTDAQFRLWEKLMTRMDRGHKVRCPDSGAFTGEGFPDSLVVEYPTPSLWRESGVRSNVAFFNWSAAPTARLLLPTPGTTARDFWSNSEITIPTEGLIFQLPPRSARLFQIEEMKS